MGRIEKVVVLSVLFLIAVIVTVSVYPREIAAGEAGRKLADEAVQAEEPRQDGAQPAARIHPPRVARGETTAGNEALQAPEESPAATGQPRRLPTPAGANTVAADTGEPASTQGRRAPDRSRRLPSTDEPPAEAPSSVLLSSSVSLDEDAPASLRGMVRELQADWDLVRAEGLRATWNDDFLVYTCKAGDDFESIARSLYGDGGKVELLRRNNEGVSRLSAGDEVWIPVRDDRGVGANEHVVQEGESLWAIATVVYGEGRRWNEIFEANRDVLQSADAVRAGMTLRIP